MARRKSRAVPYYLAVETAPVSRERLQAFFWPDHERTAAQQLLRTVLHGLRKNLNADLLVGEDALAIGAEVEVDVREFQAALSNRSTGKAGLDQALALYRGDLLADFSLPDSFEFEDWVAVEREHYRRSFLSGLGRLAEYYEAEREHGLALETVQRALQLDPLQEDFQRTALRLHFLSGDRAGAIRRYDQLRKLLDEELGVPPTHSQITFSVRHMMIARVHGRFEEFTGEVNFDEQNPALSTVNVQIEAASINTKDAKRDAHLKSADFLDAENQPYLTYTSRQVEMLDANHGRSIGDLTIRGLAREVVLETEYLGTSRSPFGGTESAGFTAQTKINRKDWDLNWNVALETGGWLVDDQIAINIDVELIKQPEAELVAVAA